MYLIHSHPRHQGAAVKCAATNSLWRGDYIFFLFLSTLFVNVFHTFWRPEHTKFLEELKEGEGGGAGGREAGGGRTGRRGRREGEEKEEEEEEEREEEEWEIRKPVPING